ncbi:hypothetical protein Taro_049261 [Colocasia esculenta]|uniref:Uncharacterized protein n=1 Tax=Colocasia esculenta TaxID=4460 RepID=A0A843XAG3_COLES|nr:hypothetical protein [Colocasia esculenta]
MEGNAKGKSQGPEDAAGVVSSSSQDVAVEEEEQQMEEFYALLKNIREMREQWRRMVGGDRPRKRSKGESSAPWTPTFEWEDFQGVADLAQGPVTGQSTSEVGRPERGGEKKEQEETSLDLKLSL